MLSFLQYLAEAIRPEIYDKVLSDMEELKSINDADVFQWNEGWMEKEFRESPLDKDKKAMRLFIPHGSAVKIRIIRLFNKYDLKMLSYKDGTVKSPDPKASHPLKIGAILTNLVSNSGITKKFGIVLNNNEDKKEATELLRLFAKDSANRNIDDGIVDIDPREEPKWIVISRDPYDVAGMSTGREWSSCQDLDGGEYCHYVPRDILAGTLVAYLIKDSDKREVVRDGDVLRLPLSRLLIKPYLNSKGETAFAMSAKQYTKNIRDPIFPIVVKKWVDEFNRKRGTKGFFTIHPAVYMGHKGGTGEISATEFEIDDEGNMVNAGKPGYYKPDRTVRDIRPSYISSNPNSIFDMADYIRDNQHDEYLEDYKEEFYEYRREAIEDAFSSFNEGRLEEFLHNMKNYIGIELEYVIDYVANVSQIKTIMYIFNEEIYAIEYIFGYNYDDRKRNRLIGNTKESVEFIGEYFADAKDFDSFYELDVAKERMIEILKEFMKHGDISDFDNDEIVKILENTKGYKNYKEIRHFIIKESGKPMFDGFDLSVINSIIDDYIESIAETKNKSYMTSLSDDITETMEMLVNTLSDDQLFMVVRENRESIYDLIIYANLENDRKIMAAIRNAVESDPRPYTDNLDMFFSLR
jgi:hypothetical protein